MDGSYGDITCQSTQLNKVGVNMFTSVRLFVYAYYIYPPPFCEPQTTNNQLYQSQPSSLNSKLVSDIPTKSTRKNPNYPFEEEKKTRSSTTLQPIQPFLFFSIPSLSPFPLVQSSKPTTPIYAHHTYTYRTRLLQPSLLHCPLNVSKPYNPEKRETGRERKRKRKSISNVMEVVSVDESSRILDRC